MTVTEPPPPGVMVILPSSLVILVPVPSSVVMVSPSARVCAQRNDARAGADRGWFIVIVPGVAGIEGVGRACGQTGECRAVLPVIRRSATALYIAILDSALSDAGNSVQRYTVCRAAGHSGRCGGGLADLGDGQLCGAGAAD